MGERTLFVGGEQAPNDGFYVEVSEQRHGSPVNDPQGVQLKRGDRFPELSDKDRKWTLRRK
ncbi:YjzC family protein [Ferroacidibacillus organovorans]|uniref:YjzC family protein n=1 Tax=Ferroacidibacillus organovorans TaxID=1765683 RepID=A0A101XNQ2_9BACL|nr:YjzC family protein [Ferroacidibacillus organovorans]KUO94737.1 hypothetical protein ATW55_09960 [Ferroacidibacillus organovorans]